MGRNVGNFIASYKTYFEKNAGAAKEPKTMLDPAPRVALDPDLVEAWRERAETYLANPKQVHWIVEMGTERARTVARQTMKDVRSAMGLSY